MAEGEGRPALLLGPDPPRDRDRTVGEGVVMAAQRPARRRQRRDRAVVERRGAAGEHPAVVGRAAAAVALLAGRERRDRRPARRSCCRRRRDGYIGRRRARRCRGSRGRPHRTGRRAAACRGRSAGGCRARPSGTCISTRRRAWSIRVASRSGRYRSQMSTSDADHGILGLGALVEIAGVEPAADREAGDMLARREARVGGRALAVEIDMLVVRAAPGGRRRDAGRRARSGRPR